MQYKEALTFGTIDPYRITQYAVSLQLHPPCTLDIGSEPQAASKLGVSSFPYRYLYAIFAEQFLDGGESDHEENFPDTTRPS